MSDSQSFAIPQAEARQAEFEEAFEAHKTDVYRWGLRYGGGNRAWAEDLTHDVFLKLWQHHSSLEARADVGGWLYTVTANLALSRLRRERGVLAQLKELLTFDEPLAPATDEVVSAQQTARSAAQQLAALPDKERVVLTMQLADGLSQRQIARTLRLSEGYVSKLLARARERVRRAGWEVPS